MLKLKSVSRNINNNFCSEPHNTITPPSPIYQYLYKIFLPNLSSHFGLKCSIPQKDKTYHLWILSHVSKSNVAVTQCSVSVLLNITITYCWNDFNYPSYWGYWHTGVDKLDELWHMRWGFSCWSYMGLLSSDELHRSCQYISYVAT